MSERLLRWISQVVLIVRVCGLLKVTTMAGVDQLNPLRRRCFSVVSARQTGAVIQCILTQLGSMLYLDPPLTGRVVLPGLDKASRSMFDEIGFPRGADLDDPAPLLATFVYCSRAAEGVDDGEVSRIIELAQRRNLTRGITGVLVFGSGVFFQWIEGPPVPINNLIASLHGDPRHYDVVALDRSEEKRERLYPSWEMERVEADDIRAVLQDALGSAEDEPSAAALRRILKHLASGPLKSLGRSQSDR